MEVAEVRDDSFHRGIVLEPFSVVECVPRDANTVLRVVNHHAPQPEFTHLKRARKVVADETTKIQVLACPQRAGDILTTIKESLSSISFANRVVDVPKFPPHTKEMLDEWNQSWPTLFRPNLVVRPSETFEGQARDRVRRYIHQSVEIAERCKMQGALGVGAVVVDPVRDVVLAEAGDESGRVDCDDGCANVDARSDLMSPHQTNSGTPLDHATMRAIEIVASQTRSIDNNGKRSREEDSAPDQYLCTGYDLYLSREPCFMCGMGILHSRFSRVFYVHSNPTQGSLGTLAKLHTVESLNHKFRVFHVTLEAETQQCSPES